jgi:DNA polymerase (family X)
MQLSNRDIADVFQAIADSMEILGQDRFRLLAYRRASEAIADLPMPLADYRARAALEDIPGIGKTIAEKIAVLLDTGSLPLHEQLKQELPAGVLDLLKVPDIGPRSARRLYQELGVCSLADLQTAIDDGRLAQLKGFGAKSVERVRQGLARLADHQRRTIMPQALQVAEQLIADLRERAPQAHEIAYAGSLRRARPTIGDLDLLAAATDTAAVIQAFRELPQIARVESAGEFKCTVILHSGMQADLLVVPPARWGSALQHFTGSQAHNIKLRALAQDRGLSFSEQGYRRADGSLLECPSEADVYAMLDLPWIPPELREDAGEFEVARNHDLPQLLRPAALQSDLHMHSIWSDGRASIADMAEAAYRRGLRAIAITDHSAYLGVTGGVDARRLQEQAADVAALNAQYQQRGVDFTILHGVEVDITPEGTLALPDEALATLDIVVASLHVSLRQPREQVTERLLRAIANPHVDMIAHPTGRILERREGADLDMEAILQAAVAAGKLLEVNSGPDRLDLDAQHVRRAIELGATIVVNSDAHHPQDLAWTRYGVLTARRGWAPAERVANTWPIERLREYLR